MITIKSGAGIADYFGAMTWMKIETAPFNRDIEVAVIEADGEIYAVVFPCRRVAAGWIKAASGNPVEIHPTHWREWEVSR